MPLTPDADGVITVSTNSATIRITPEYVQIAKRGIGALWQGGPWHGARQIALDQITAIEWRDAGLIKEGYLQIVYSGNVPRDPYHDESAVIFKKRNQGKLEEVKVELERRVKEARAAARGAPVAQSGADEIGRLAELRDRGILTEDEFQAKKQQILGL
jgi:hypothetical protein